MANTYYDSELTAEEIEQALEAIDGVIVPANNGKVLAINNGKIEARSVQWDADLGPKSITENGTYNPASDNLDGYSQVTVNVSGGGGTTDANHVTYNSSETYDSGTVGAALNEQRNTLYTIGGQTKEWINNAELNSYTQTGTFSIGTGATVGGSAFGFTYFLLTVIAPRTDTLNQIVEYDNNTYTREYRNGSWSSFEKVITTKDVGKFAVYSFNNAQTCVFELSAAPSQSTYGTFILFNANQNTMGLVKLETVPSVASLYGTITYAISLSGKTVTITPSGRLWGKTVIAGVYD